MQIPDNLRPAVTLLAKYHFWILAALVPLLLLPLPFAARGGLMEQISAARSQIKGRLDGVRGVQSVAPHPNEGWAAEIDADATRIRRETLAEWQKFWDGQAFLRVWPEQLGQDFLTAVAALKPGVPLNRNLLQRYQNQIPEIVKQLPARMGADEAMDGAVPVAPPVGGAPAKASTALVAWSAADQGRLRQAFTWPTLPTNPQAATTQIVLAQEELWVYGQLCDAIARANRGAGGVYNAAIVAVDQLAVGYPAAEERPGGMGSSRIVIPKSAAGAEGDGGLQAPATEGAGSMVKPPHPRFGGAGGGPMAAEPAPPADGGPVAAPDAAFREWIYVDFAGKPLSAAEVATSPAAAMVHLVPFVLKITIDQRKLDALLVDLARSPIPVDVREVRVLSAADPAAAANGSAANAERSHDVVVELRGTVGLATPPSAAAVGLQPAAAPAAAAVTRRRRMAS